jgi:streptogramin lyase
VLSPGVEGDSPAERGQVADSDQRRRALVGGELWATTAKGVIEEIDPETGAVLSKTQPHGTSFTGLTAADGELWAWDGNTVQVDDFRTT